MAVLFRRTEVLNRTRRTTLATAVAMADTHWTRLRGLLGLNSDDFGNGCALWIVPCHGVHTLGMGFAIDVVYLDRSMTVVHVERGLRPWRFAPVRMQALSVLELPSGTTTETKTEVGDKIEITPERIPIRTAIKMTMEQTPEKVGGVVPA